MKHRHARILTLSFLLLLALAAPSAHADTGFVDSPLLLSPEAPKDGDTVTLSVLFHNAESSTITGTVLFYDNQTLLARKSLNISPGDVGIADTSFEISSGIHKFSATMSDIDAAGREGKPIIISETTVTLPAAVVTKKLGLGAQAAGDSTGSESAILKKVDAAETAVLDAIPDGAKEAVSKVFSGIDEWRDGAGEKFVTQRDQAKVSIDAGKKIDAENATLKPGAKPKAKPGAADNGAAKQVQHIFYGMLAFFFSKAFAFYLGSVIILYFVLRFIFRRIRAMRGR